MTDLGGRNRSIHSVTEAGGRAGRQMDDTELSCKNLGKKRSRLDARGENEGSYRPTYLQAIVSLKGWL